MVILLFSVYLHQYLMSIDYCTHVSGYLVNSKPERMRKAQDTRLSWQVFATLCAATVSETWYGQA